MPLHGRHKHCRGGGGGGRPRWPMSPGDRYSGEVLGRPQHHRVAVEGANVPQGVEQPRPHRDPSRLSSRERARWHARVAAQGA